MTRSKKEVIDDGGGALPVYRWGLAPDHLATRRQLRAAGLRPGGADPVAELSWRRGRRTALLFDRRSAVAVRPMTPARWRAVARALLARHTCTACDRVFEHHLPAGRMCPACERVELEDVLGGMAV